jgi:hypothetical protein
MSARRAHAAQSRGPRSRAQAPDAGICGLGVDDDTAAAPIAARIIAWAVRAVLQPALASLYGLHLGYMGQRRERAAAKRANARLRASDGEARQNER